MAHETQERMTDGMTEERMTDGMERRRYRFQTALPETVIEDLRANGLRLTAVAISLGDTYGLYAIELVAAGSAPTLEAAEVTWGLVADMRAVPAPPGTPGTPGASNSFRAAHQ